MWRPAPPSSHRPCSVSLLLRQLGRATFFATSVLALAGCDDSRPAPITGDQPSPVSHDRETVIEPGLEVITWVSAADDRALAQALAPHTQPPPGMDRKLARLWADNGLRLIALPSDQVAPVQAALSVGPGSVHTQWLGQAFNWTPLVVGPALPPATLIATDADRLRLPAGALRVLTRCWLAPVPESQVAGESGSPRAVLRIELLPQHHEAPDSADALITRTTLSATDEGLVFSRLAASIAARPGAAYLLLAEDPSVDWSDPEPMGEVGPRPPTIGEAMLLGAMTKASAAAGPQIPARSRLVVLLRPRVPERFSLSP